MTVKTPIVHDGKKHSKLASTDKLDANFIDISSNKENLLKVNGTGLYVPTLSATDVQALPIKGGNVNSLTVDNKNVLVDGTVGLNSTKLPFLEDFNTYNNKSGFYYALGAGTSTPTANCPPLTGNNKLTVTVRNDSFGAKVVHYEVIENTNKKAIKWIGEYYNNDNPPYTVWTKVLLEGDNGVGAGQTWHGFTKEERLFDVTYTNTTDKPIMVFVCVSSKESGIDNVRLIPNVGVHSFNMVSGKNPNDGIRYFASGSFIVPAGESYRVSTNAQYEQWLELR